MKKKKIRKVVLILILLLGVAFLWRGNMASAISEDKIVNILRKNSSLFESNSIGSSVLRYIGWGITKGLASVAKSAANLYDTCFDFVDFTKYKPVREFINEWEDVFVALVTLSLLLIGVLLIIGWDKKPKILINGLIALAVMTSSSYVINRMNSLISNEVRTEILGEESASSVVYETVGANIHDLLYLDQSVGLENLNKENNADLVYDSFTKTQFKNIKINETVDPDDFEGDAAEILDQALEMKVGKGNTFVYGLQSIYGGVAWTDLLNEYYYRYSVEWGVMWLELISLAIIYLFFSYKVIRILYEIVVHRLLAVLYAANLNNNQKILKIFESLKDSYIVLLLISCLIKFYLLACKFIAAWDVSGLTKGLIVLFLAFAVIDGPNLIQKLTGQDAGVSDGLGKMMGMMYGTHMAAGTVRTAGHMVKNAPGTIKGGINKVKGALDKGGGKNQEPDTGGKDQNQPNGENERNPGSNPQENPGGNPEDSSGGREENQMGAEAGGNGESPPDMDAGGEEGNPDAGKSALNAGQEKKEPGDVGSGLRTKRDALNGKMDGKKSATDDLKKMDQATSPDRKTGDYESGGMNRPLDAGGNMFARDIGGNAQAPDIAASTGKTGSIPTGTQAEPTTGGSSRNSSGAARMVQREDLQS